MLFFPGGLNYGIAFLLSLRRHPPWVVSKNQYMVDYFLFYCKYHLVVNEFLNIMGSYFLAL